MAKAATATAKENTKATTTKEPAPLSQSAIWYQGCGVTIDDTLAIRGTLIRAGMTSKQVDRQHEGVARRLNAVMSQRLKDYTDEVIKKLDAANDGLAQKLYGIIQQEREAAYAAGRLDAQKDAEQTQK
jgi:hypothetical protein